MDRAVVARGCEQYGVGGAAVHTTAGPSFVPPCLPAQVCMFLAALRLGLV